MEQIIPRNIINIMKQTLLQKYPSADRIWIIPMTTEECGGYVYQAIITVEQKIYELILEAVR